MSWRPAADWERREEASCRRACSPPRPFPARPARSPGRPAAEPGTPGRSSAAAGVASAALCGRAGGQERRARGAEGAPRRFVSSLLERGERLLPRPAARARGGGGGGSGSSFTPLLSSPLSRRQRRRRQRWGQADSAPSHTEGSSQSPLAALNTLPSPARSARTSVSWTNLAKQAGIYEWKGDQAQRGERCF